MFARPLYSEFKAGNAQTGQTGSFSWSGPSHLCGVERKRPARVYQRGR